MSSNDAPSPVSWQTVFWTLIPLATNVMTQPSGRILSQPSRYRTYLRSSPIISFLDALALLLRILLTSCLLHVSITHALEITIRERYKDTEDTSEGIQSLEKQTWLRWVFFVVGTLGPSIKLMVMQGVPWTKAWGAMFLFAFLVIEIMALLRKRSVMPSTYTTLPEINDQPIRGGIERQVIRNVEGVETFAFWVALVVHLAILVWAFFDVWILRGSAYNTAETSKVASLVSLLYIAYVGGVVTFGVPLTLVCFFSIFVNLHQEYPIRSYGGKWAHRGCISLLVIGGTVAIGCAIYGIYNDHGLILDGLFFNLSLVCAPIFVFIISKLCKLSQKLGETLLVSSSDRDSSGADSGAVWSLTFCMANIALCLLWYWLRYNAASTLNPPWTGVFG